MTFRISGITILPDEGKEALMQRVAALFAVSREAILSVKVIKKSVDARRNRPPLFAYVLDVTVSEEVTPSIQCVKGISIEAIQEEAKQTFCTAAIKPQKRPVIIGCGPAGLFAAMTLVSRGISPILVERGRPVQERAVDVGNFWEKRALDPESNVYFGEGGAGTFSDGKLTSRVRNPHTTWIKEILVDMGAPSEILTEGKPHIGTDRLREVVTHLRQTLIEKGCEVRFQSKVTDFLISHGRMEGVVVNGNEEIRTNDLIVALGQSADDTYKKLRERGVFLAAKPFAIGLRVEHPQELINQIQYGKWHNHPDLPPAEYFLTAKLPERERSVYSFCMCPGGSVVGCSPVAGRVVTNGMSDYLRNGRYANSAVVVNVQPDDFMGTDDSPLAGIAFRKIWEEKAYTLGGENYNAPAQRLLDFLQDRPGTLPESITFAPGVKAVSLAEALPMFVVEALKLGFKQFDRKMRGYITQDAVLIGIETRTSSPVRILRNPDGQSVSVSGLYPCGEGAGYAGGIISSALDGIRIAAGIATS